MKIVIALDKFKGSLSAPAACQVVRDTLAAEHPDWELVCKPMADGGEGTAAALVEARRGTWEPATVMGPRPELAQTARYGWFEADRSAVVEMASASGLVLLAPGQRDPLRTTTYGTGQLLGAARDRGARRIWLTVGGSATVDGGVGAAMALGWQFLDAAGQSIGFGGGALRRLAKLLPPVNEHDPSLSRADRDRTPDLPEIEALCDVDNPLCGEHGAARVFGPQKGASPAVVEQLEAGLAQLAEVVRTQLGCEIDCVPGAGAAGGLAAGARAFFGARLVPGIDAVIEATGLPDDLDQADWLITGEGRFDRQSLRGKVVSGLSRLARNCGTKVAVLAGGVDLEPAQYRAAGIDVALACQQPGQSLQDALAHAGELLAAASQTWARQILTAGE